MPEKPQSWRDWFGFARHTLGYEPPEATEYANRRYAEDLNRSARSRATAAARDRKGIFPLPGQ